MSESWQNPKMCAPTGFQSAGQEGNQPAVKGLTVNIKLMSGVIALLPRNKVDGAHGEKLGPSQNSLGQSQTKAGQHFLGIRGQQAAAAFFKAPGKGPA